MLSSAWICKCEKVEEGLEVWPMACLRNSFVHSPPPLSSLGDVKPVWENFLLLVVSCLFQLMKEIQALIVNAKWTQSSEFVALFPLLIPPAPGLQHVAVLQRAARGQRHSWSDWAHAGGPVLAAATWPCCGAAGASAETAALLMPVGPGSPIPDLAASGERQWEAPRPAPNPVMWCIN